MKKYLLILAALIFSLQLLAQDKEALKKEIDQQIWYPFMLAWNNLDAVAFNAIHSDNMVRGTPRKLRTGKEYKKGNLKSFAKSKEKGGQRRISFTFEYRVHQENMAYEVGYYKIESDREGETNYYYGQFHVVSKKINGQWKIVQDWDADKISGEKVGEEHFMKYAESGIYEIR